MRGRDRMARQVGHALRRLRLKRRRSRQRIAVRAGISAAELAAYEAGQQLPDLGTLRQLVMALGTTADGFGRYLGPWGAVDLEIRFTVS